jgi:hypothetical protein
MPELDKNEERVIMKIAGVMVDMLVSMAPETYKRFVR